jgi:nicotinamidase-related amidase
MHRNALQLGKSVLIIIDMQEAFREKIEKFTKVAEAIGVMTQAAKLLQVPTLVTEQYPKGLGHTASEIAEVLPAETEIIEKTTFSSCVASPFLEQLRKTNASQVIVSGIEAHICVNQTVHDLLASEYQVHILLDCIASRKSKDRKVGIAKMQSAGAIPCSVEMALFELMRDAKHDQFKAIQKLVK